MVDGLGKYEQACMEAWLNCENLLIALKKSETDLSIQVRQVIDECAQLCLGTFHALKRKMKNISHLALLCVGICEECAELCEKFSEDHFITCASACRKCSSSITELAVAAIK
jgi:hypothetical protein